MKKLVFVLSLLLIGCDQSISNEYLLYSSLPPDEKEAFAPNPLFQSVLNKDDIETFKQVFLDSEISYLLSVNHQGDTPLGLALKTYYYEGARYLISQMAAKYFTHQNKEGDSYIYLASQSGYADLIKMMADKYNDYVFDYEFSDLDLQNNQGQKALHIARHEGVIGALEAEYYRGLVELPWSKFSFAVDNDRNNFLHTAVSDNRTSVLSWWVGKKCKTTAELQERGKFKNFIYHSWGLINRHYTSLSGFEIDNIINEQNFDGDTPIHLAAKNTSIPSLQILTACDLIDYLLTNDEGDIPLQTFLKNLDVNLMEQDQQTKDMFVLIAESKSPYSVSSLKKYINHTNKEGNTSLHLAARILDPFFYNYLKKYGSTTQVNQEGETPEYIFNSWHKVQN